MKRDDEGRTVRVTESQLRRLVLRILQEADLSGKSLDLVDQIVGINASLADAGLEFEIGLLMKLRGWVKIEFAARDRSKKDRPRSYRLQDLQHAAITPGSVIYQLQLQARPADARLDWAYATLAERAAEAALDQVPWGTIIIAPAVGEGSDPCGGSWVVEQTSSTRSGWGPLLYDVAMELATVQGGGLTSDRAIVSADARGVWDKYDRARGDVEAMQLDVSSDLLQGYPDRFGSQLTPDDPSDDCEQISALRDSPGAGAWHQSPLSRAYRKPDGAVMAALEAAGLLWR
jgi:hypothetical protein